jgi:hypothetical protein
MTYIQYPSTYVLYLPYVRTYNRLRSLECLDQRCRMPRHQDLSGCVTVTVTEMTTCDMMCDNLLSSCLESDEEENEGTNERTLLLHIIIILQYIHSYRESTPHRIRYRYRYPAPGHTTVVLALENCPTTDTYIILQLRYPLDHFIFHSCRTGPDRTIDPYRTVPTIERKKEPLTE